MHKYVTRCFKSYLQLYFANMKSIQLLCVLILTRCPLLYSLITFLMMTLSLFPLELSYKERWLTSPSRTQHFINVIFHVSITLG